MSRQKQSFRFRLPWLPSLVAAPLPPARYSSSQRNRKTAPPPSGDLAGVIPIRSMAATSESQTPLPETQVLPQQLESHQLPPGEELEPSVTKTELKRVQPTDIIPPQVNQQPLTQAAMSHSTTDSQPPSGTSSAPLQAPPKKATPSHGTELRPLQMDIDFQPPLTKTESPPPETVLQPRSPTRESMLIQAKSQSSSPSQKPSPTRVTSGNPIRANSQLPSSARLVNAKLSSPSNAGNHTRSTLKNPSPSRAVAHPRTTSLPPVPSRAVKSATTSSKPPSPPFSPSLQSSSSYSTGESSNLSNQQSTSSPKSSQHVKNSKAQSHATQEYEQKPAQVEAIQPDADSEAVRSNISETPIIVYDKMEPEPLQASEAIATRLTEHPSTEEDERHWSARNKGNGKLLFTKRASRSSQDSGENRRKAHHSYHEKMKNDVSDFIEKLSLGKLGQSRSEDPVSIITISGDNKGATLHLGMASSVDGKALSREDEMKTTSDGEGYCGGRKREDRGHQTNKAYINSNIQSINNSMLLSSSVCERNPGVHLGKNGLVLEPDTKEVKSTSAAYQPAIIRRRCLRGLFMDSSESEADNPDKPRRHGCRVGCGDQGKHDF